MPYFHDRLKELRQSKKMTQKLVATIIDITERSYISLENAKTAPSVATLNKLADYFNVSTDYLLGRSDNPGWYDKYCQDSTGSIEVKTPSNTLNPDTIKINPPHAPMEDTKSDAHSYPTEPAEGEERQRATSGKHGLAYQDYLDGMKSQEIAVKYGVSQTTVRSWKFRYNWQR